MNLKLQVTKINESFEVLSPFPYIEQGKELSMLYEVALFCESVDEILKSDQSNKSFQTVLSVAIVYYVVQGGCTF